MNTKEMIAAVEAGKLDENLKRVYVTDEAV